ncbi:hypothetical protein [Aquimarina mytili]|uniref:Lipoprotein n=1 Tax=Aquimarina mytili TaxID=874423 RepID=A0A937A750_9FLAO|nr:hypothetical protein [Aquimarina mytili]MBL0685474.1 hypothetical protein [Aquimarina mytili]
MKKRGNFGVFFGVVLCLLLITSCEQPDGEAEFINTNDKKDFVQDDIFIEENEFELTKPVLRLSYDPNLTEEEASTRFNEAIVAYKQKNATQNKGLSTEWFFRIATLTGAQSNNDTDGQVRASVYFNTDKGSHASKNIILDYPSIDERELGQWDYYLFKTFLPGEAVKWVQISSSAIRLQGTDEWFVKQFHTYMVAQDQTAPANGATNIYTFPNIFLYSPCATCWDSYQKRGGYGKLKF